MQKGRIRHMFPGGNSSKGFYSYYEYILPQEQARRIFIIKGGPGVGKSTFMKKTALEMVERGFDVEQMHCSSDNNSLDGIVIPKLRVAMIDGTAPHVVDPKNPGAVDEIIHLGDFWDEAGMVKYRDEIMKTNREVGELFRRAYKYLGAAYCIYEDMCEIFSKSVNEAEINQIAKELVTEIIGAASVAEKPGKLRRLFASAITPDGLKLFPDTVMDGYKCYNVQDYPSLKTSKILERIRDSALETGYNLEGFHCAFIPEKLEHMVIPSLGLAITTSNIYHDFGKSFTKVYDLNAAVDPDIFGNMKLAYEYDRCEFDELLAMAVKTIKEAKSLHDVMEKYYIPNMDFEAVQICWENTMERILEYADSY